MRGWVELNLDLYTAAWSEQCVVQRFCYHLSLPCSRAIQNASNIVDLDYLVSLTVNVLHNTYHEVV